LHPFTPFVTEELWGHLRRALLESPLAELASDWPEALITARWPAPRPLEGWEEAKVADFVLVQDVVRSIRNLRAEKNVPPAKRLQAAIAAGAKTDLLQAQAAIIAALAGLDPAGLKIASALPKKPEAAVALVVGPAEIHLPLAGMLDVEAERARLSRELAESESHIERLEKLLASDFASKAPPAVVQKEREKLAALADTAEKLRAQLE
jgi:valyl-tRNA synthetase